MNIIKIPLDRWDGHDPPYKYNERTGHIRYIVIHTTGGIDSKSWLSKWNKTNTVSAQNNVSIHYLAQRDGNVYQIIDDVKRAWHVGISHMSDGETDGNSVTIGIEIEHLNEPDFTDIQLNNVAELVHDLMNTHGIDGKHVVSHASIARPAGRKVDPVNFDWEDFWTRVASFDKKQSTPQEVLVAPVAVLPYTHRSLTLATPQIDAQKLIEYLVHKHTYVNYTHEDIRLILTYYVTYGKQVGVDYVFAIAQMIHETGWTDSWWAARPRRNPAGIGVTGQTTTKNPNDDARWAKSGNVWRKGRSFASWDIGVQQHIARLLLYARTDEQMTPEQRTFAAICLDQHRLEHIRGVANKWVGFNGTWAVPGTTYSQKLATIANSFVTASQ